MLDLEDRGIRAVETPDAVERFVALKEIAREARANLWGRPLTTNEITTEHVRHLTEFIGQAALLISPPVMPALWEHALIAQELGGGMAEQAAQNGLDINPQAMRAALLVHDIFGRFVTPGAYLRNDFVGNRILQELGLGELNGQLQYLHHLLMWAEKLDISKNQLEKFKQGLPIEDILIDEQLRQAEVYFKQLTPVQRIAIVADNLGKRDKDGQLFSVEKFFDYLRTQEDRYDPTSPWPSINWSIPRRQASAVLQAFVVEKAINWLNQEYNVEVESILEELQDYGPKFILLARHGSVHNPNNITYNQDGNTEVMHLSEQGRQQVKQLAQLINKRGLRCMRLISSQETRAQESATIIDSVLNFGQVDTDVKIDDVFAPGPYKKKLTLDEFARQYNGNIYTDEWQEYGHESAEQVVQRMNQAFRDAAGELKVGQAAIMVSHGDALAWLAKYLFFDKVPYPQTLRDSILYPEKGSGLLVVIGPDNRVISVYPFTDPSLAQSELY